MTMAREPFHSQIGERIGLYYRQQLQNTTVRVLLETVERRQCLRNKECNCKLFPFYIFVFVVVVVDGVLFVRSFHLSISSASTLLPHIQMLKC